MRKLLFLAALFASSPALAQWQTPLNSIPVGRGAGTGFNSAAAGTNGQLFLGVTGSPPQMGTMSQDCAITNAGVITCTKTNNVAFAPSATTDTTNAANISSGTLLFARFPTGTDINALSTKTANYGIIASDAGKTIYATGGPFTVTLPAVSGFASDAQVTVCNGDANDNTHHAIKLSGFPSPIFSRLYMQQCVTVAIENGFWAAKSVPGRFRPAFTPTLFIDTGGSSANDGLVSNAAANAIDSLNTCLQIFQNEYDFTNSMQPICSPTSGQTKASSTSLIGPLLGTSVVNVTGNGGVSTLQPTASGTSVIFLGNFAPYLIFSNITADCTGGTAACTVLYFHQQTGADLNGLTIKGNAAGHNGIVCDGMCKINAANSVAFAGSLSNGISADYGSMISLNAGASLAASATFANSVFNFAHGSVLNFSGALTDNGATSISEIVTLRSGSVGCFNSNFTKSGTFTGARQWSVLNNSVLANTSAVAIPGSAGISTAATFAAGVLVNSALSSGGC